MKQEKQREQFDCWLLDWHNYQNNELAKHIQTCHGVDGWEY